MAAGGAGLLLPRQRRCQRRCGGGINTLSRAQYTWSVTAEGAKTINAGSYFSSIVTGQSIVLTTDTTGLEG